MLPAVRSLLALPEPAKERMAEFLELVEGVPLTADVETELAAQPHYVKTPLWIVRHMKQNRSVRTRSGKITYTGEIEVEAYFPSVGIPADAQNWSEEVNLEA